jgi:hypothetical protein
LPLKALFLLVSPEGFILAQLVDALDTWGAAVASKSDWGTVQNIGIRGTLVRVGKIRVSTARRNSGTILVRESPGGANSDKSDNGNGDVLHAARVNVNTKVGSYTYENFTLGGSSRGVVVLNKEVVNCRIPLVGNFENDLLALLLLDLNGVSLGRGDTDLLGFGASLVSAFVGAGGSDARASLVSAFVGAGGSDAKEVEQHSDGNKLHIDRASFRDWNYEKKTVKDV